jgi:SAM-dependent methyltransferase
MYDFRQDRFVRESSSSCAPDDGHGARRREDLPEAFVHAGDPLFDPGWEVSALRHSFTMVGSPRYDPLTPGQVEEVAEDAETVLTSFSCPPAARLDAMLAAEVSLRGPHKENNMSDRVSARYDRAYFDWQSSIGEFGGWANQSKFAAYIPSHGTVLDFGCGGGFLLKGLNCGKKVGIEVNSAAAETARQNGIEVFSRVEDVPDDYVDVAISDNALEHTLQPLTELKSLFKKLKTGGKIVFVVPCESIGYRYQPNDINHHLYSWSPMCIGNLFSGAGFSVIESRPYIHKWPRRYGLIARIGGKRLFEVACRIYGQIERSWFQVRVIAEKRSP